MLDYKIQQLSKGSSEGYGIILEVSDEPKENSGSSSSSLLDLMMKVFGLYTTRLLHAGILILMRLEESLESTQEKIAGSSEGYGIILEVSDEPKENSGSSSSSLLDLMMKFKTSPVMRKTTLMKTKLMHKLKRNKLEMNNQFNSVIC
nr:hypothetical protein [Tanacetum cinerariifolium]